MKKSITIIIIVLAVTAGVYFLIRGEYRLEQKKEIQQQQQQVKPDSFGQNLPTIKIGDVLIEAEVAKTPEERARGLSGRTALGENQGMLFVFDKPGFYSFWMKDMNFPIDIIWIDENYRVLDITKNISPDTFPQLFQPPKPVQYVLEVNAGFSDRNNIKIGDVVDFSDSNFGDGTVSVINTETLSLEELHNSVVVNLNGDER